MPRWQLPERWSFITEVPKTSVGKFAKTRMRESYARGDYEVVEAPLTRRGSGAVTRFAADAADHTAGAARLARYSAM